VRAWRLPALLLLAAAAAGACTEAATDPAAPLSIAFDSLPVPAVVIGDTLRDVEGNVAPLMARAYNTAGDTIGGAPIRYFYVPTDTTAAARAEVQVDSITGIVVASPQARVNATGRLFARVGTLQSADLPLTVVPRPDAMAPADTAADTVRYVPGDSVASESEVATVLVTHDSAGIPVQSYGVGYSLLHGGTTVADSVKLGVRGRSATRALTGTSGVAGPRLRVFAKRGVTAVDSLVLEARVQFQGRPVRGSPDTLVVRLVPQTSR
jgi:hypothetical protein